jgi:hypothetical protein
LIISSALIIAACKKTDVSTRNGETNPNALRSAVKVWKDQISKTASLEIKSAVDSILPTLNYDDGFIHTTGNRTMFFIKKSSFTDRNQYLALVQNNGDIQIEGIYDVKSLIQIEEFFRTKKIAVGEDISVYSLLHKRIMQWETDKNGKSVFRVVQHLDPPGAFNNKVQSMNVKKRTYSALPPDPNNPQQCLDWYWVTYDVETGEIIDVTYLYTTCADNNNGGGGGGGSSSTPIDMDNFCSATPTQAAAALNDISAANSTDETTAIYSNEQNAATSDQPYAIRRPAIVSWPIEKITFSTSYVASYAATYSGTIKKKNPNIAADPWRWESLQYSSIMQTSGYTPPCLSIEWAATSAIAFSSDSVTAYADIIYTAKAIATCAFGSQWKNIKYNTKMTSFTAKQSF